MGRVATRNLGTLDTWASMKCPPTYSNLQLKLYQNYKATLPSHAPCWPRPILFLGIISEGVNEKDAIVMELPIPNTTPKQPPLLRCKLHISTDLDPLIPYFPFIDLTHYPLLDVLVGGGESGTWPYPGFPTA